PVISSTTTYYVEESDTYTGAINATGQLNHTGTSLYSTGVTNSGVDFDVLAPCTLNTVKVYTVTAGTRTIQLKNSTGTVINSLTINVPADTTILTLNFPLTPGTGYQLTTDGALNTTNFGTTNPKFQRSSSGVSYPYTIPGMISLTGSDQGPSYYYYFYDWKVQAPSYNCISARTPVTATVTSSVGINTFDSDNIVSVYPNPASDLVNILFGSAVNASAVIEMTDLTGRVVGSWSVENALQGQTKQLNVAAMSAGTYFVTVKTGTDKMIQKLILTK
nr:T9SS type A sorting domain-containing protein [Bacteroidota bacterium]